MKRIRISFVVFVASGLFAACGEDVSSTLSSPVQASVRFEVRGLSSAEYPDDPDLGYMSSDNDPAYFTSGSIRPTTSGTYDVLFFSKTSTSSPSVELSGIDLMEFMPSIPVHLKEDPYLSLLAVVNQEWNRNQVCFRAGEFRATDTTIVRVDLARNCLNAYLWEVVLFKTENGNELPFAHGWFDFPKELYARLFEQRNGVPFSVYASSLEFWADPPRHHVDHARLAIITDTIRTRWKDLSESMYPLVGARSRKYKEVVRPIPFATMRELQTDSALFATFSPPGFYDRSDPRKTALGRIRQLDGVALFKTLPPSGADTLHELRWSFKDIDGHRRTMMVVGGLDLYELPHAGSEEVETGWKNSMGFSNHTFYETYAAHTTWHSNSNPYYAYLTDEKGDWLDSHQVGIDGPVMYWDELRPNVLHIWLLSFERHAFVGHYTIEVIGTEHS